MPATSSQSARTSSLGIRPEEKARRQRRREAVNPNALAFTIRDAQAVGAPGSTKIYELIKTGKLASFVDAAGRRMIVGDSLRAMLSA